MLHFVVVGMGLPPKWTILVRSNYIFKLGSLCGFCAFLHSSSSYSEGPLWRKIQQKRRPTLPTTSTRCFLRLGKHLRISLNKFPQLVSIENGAVQQEPPAPRFSPGLVRIFPDLVISHMRSWGQVGRVHEAFVVVSL